MSERPKVPSHAILLNLPEERQAQIAEWCSKPNERDGAGKPIPKTGGLAFARAQLEADGLKVSLDTLSRFFCSWKLARDLDLGFDVEAQVMARTGDVQMAREASESVLLRLGLARQDPELIMAAARTHDSRRKLDLDEASGKTKAEHKERELAQKERDYSLAREKFELEAAEKMLSAALRAKADEINASGMSNAAKIAAMRQAAFAEIDELQASGKVVIPK